MINAVTRELRRRFQRGSGPGLAAALLLALPGCGSGAGGAVSDSGADASALRHGDGGVSMDGMSRLDAGGHDTAMSIQLGGGGDSSMDADSQSDTGGEPETSPPRDSSVGDHVAPGDGSQSSDARPSEGGREGGDTGLHDGGAGDAAGADASKGRDSGAGDSGAQPDVGVDAGTCDLVSQVGCKATEECTLGDSNEPVCAPNGTKTVGQVCGTLATDSCVAGDLCSTDSANGTFTCQQFCNVDSDCTQPAVGPAGNGPYCILGLEGTSVQLCTVPCNPVIAAGPSQCQTGQVCSYGGTDTITELTECATGGAGTDGVTCTGGQDCAQGFTCITGGGGMSACRQVCRAGRTSDCGKPTESCFGLPDATMYGICCPMAGC